MKILLATGIYPPEIGGPATYVHALAEELTQMNVEVMVVTYGEESGIGNRESGNALIVHYVSRSFPLLRWFSYASALRKHAKNADLVYAFSSVSCGIPLVLSGVPKKKRILRLGGDFFWERYTDRGGRKSLREWYRRYSLTRFVSAWLLKSFRYIVFSTEFQKNLYEGAFAKLPQHSVIENALPEAWNPQEHYVRNPFRLLVMSRLVRFKNVESLVEAMTLLPEHILLTIVGEGPCKPKLQKLVRAYDLDGRVGFTSSVGGKEKRQLFGVHDLMVVPSLTDISPNAALEAASAGLPVLLTKETGLTGSLTTNMILTELRTSQQIAVAIQNIQKNYPTSKILNSPIRPWSTVAEDHVSLFTSLI